MPSAGAIHLVGDNGRAAAAAGNRDNTAARQGKIKLQDNDDDKKNNICAVKDGGAVGGGGGGVGLVGGVTRAANVPQLSKVKVKCENRGLVVYLSVAGFILILCSSVVSWCLLYGHANRRADERDTTRADDDVSAFRRHLTSDFAVEEIRRITRHVILEEMPTLFTAIYSSDRLNTLPGAQQDGDEKEVEEEQEDARRTIKNERKAVRPKRSSNFRSDNGLAQQPADQPSGPVVEFFNPKIRHELEKKDVDHLKRTGGKGAAPGGDSWVWLTSYSRIPAEAITGFCRATKEYCPPGPPGLPGIPGPKGNRGDVGLPGPPGLDGKEGALGPRGPKGERGLPGTGGLDGRDGVPGEPGLDGIPGRAGADGIPGRHGKDGIPGIDGRNGENGQDGLSGPIGPPGPPGIPGEKGLSGPRGRAGKPGTNGTPGIPGINAWKVKVNGTYSSDLLIPPSISGMSAADVHKAIVVQEGDNLRLRCAATGNPKPDIEWRRIDNRPISNGAWEASSMMGHTLNITKINRVHMGTYKCFADNGIPPTANATFNIEVQFEPLIRVRNQNLYAANGTYVIMECEVEAFPDPVRYWERASDGRLLDPGLRYRIETSNDGYKSTMRLNMTIMGPQDHGDYHCVSKNELGITKGVFHVQGRSSLIRPLPEEEKIVVFGNHPPPKVTLDDLCPPPPPPCKDCPDPKEKCRDTILSLYDLIGMELEITPTGNQRYPGLPNRTMDCVLYAVGKPVYHKSVDQSYGAWMKDPQTGSDLDAEKIWVTKENDTQRLYEYANKDDFRTNKHSKFYRLERAFHGNTHTVYNGSFYYQEQDHARIIRYNLRQDRRIGSKDIPNAVATGPKHLYTTEHNYFDFNIDENGLWLIYGLAESNNTIVTKMDAFTLDFQYSWNISVNHRKVGEMFIVCGVLYAIDSGTERNTKIRLALDLYNSKVLDPTLTFTNPFRKTTAVAYNYRSKELFTWDRGNQLTYPIRYHSIGYDSTSMEKGDDMQVQLQTGYEIDHE